MTWLKSDSGHKAPRDPLARGRAPAVAPAQVPEALIDADGEPTCSVFEAMGVGNDQGIWGEEQTRFPADMERELFKEYGWPSERQWALTRRLMTRDIEAR